MKHTPESFAALLHGREYPFELSRPEQADARASGLVVVMGASDDLCEFYGALHDEVGCNDGGTIRFNAKGVVPEPDRDELEVLEKFSVDGQIFNGCAIIDAVWGGETADERKCSWCYKADFPHATFDVMEDDELYCQGIVFRLEDAFKGKGRGTSAKHTPGPWHTGGIFYKEGKPHSQNVYGPTQDGMQSGEMICANAKIEHAPLIAAAPELLQISIRLQEWDKKWPKYHDRSGESEREMNVICADAAALAAKATGEVQP